jgi:signal transduction histidine kinase
MAVAAATGLLVWTVSWGLAVDAEPGLPIWPALLDLMLAIAALVAAGFRHRAPTAVAVGVAAVSGWSAASLGALALVVISLSARRRPAAIAAVVAVQLGSTVSADLWLPGPSSVGTEMTLAEFLAAALVGNALLVLVGLAIGARRAELDGLRREAVLLRAGQDAGAERARIGERGRIARELHDELGHRLSVIAVHSAALQYRPDMSDEQRTQSVAAIRDAAQRALVDLRHTLGMLAESPSGDEPSPDLHERLRQLVADVRRAGTPVVAELAPAVVAGALPDDLARHVFRIVQECLTNALRHAPGHEVRLSVTGTAGDRVVVRSENAVPVGTLPGGGSARGLVGIGERARLAGGGLVVDRDDPRRFVVEAVLPWPG